MVKKPSTYTYTSGRLQKRSTDGSIRIWDSDKGTCETTLNGHKGAVTAFRYNKAGLLLVKIMMLFCGMSSEKPVFFFSPSRSSRSGD